MKKIIVIEKCVECPYFNKILRKDIQYYCFGRPNVHRLAHNVQEIPADCPLKTLAEDSKQPS